MYKCTKRLGCSGKNISPYSTDGELKYEVCNDCGLIWRSADSMHLTKTYEQVYFDSKKYGKRRKHKVKKSGWLIDLARVNHPALKSLLEVGCSIGYTLEAAKNRNIQHLGIDISDYAVETCKSLGLNAQNVTFDDLKSRKQRYDLIFMQHVLEHFNDPFQTLNDCFELLNDKGLVVILVPNSTYNRAVKKNSAHRFYSINGVGAEHYVYFNYTNIQKVLKATGFEVVQKNYPVFTKKYFSVEFFLNRIFRRLLTFFNSDQELLVIAQKVKKH